MTTLAYKLRNLLLLGIAAMLWSGPASAQTEGTAAKVKAAYLYNIAKFVDWPEGTIDDRIVIGIVGEHPFGDQLPRLACQKAAGKNLMVQRLDFGDDLSDCHIVFLGRGEAGACAAALADLTDRPQLTVSEEAGFAADGGVIELYQVGDKVRIRINTAAAAAQHLKLSRRLLSVADIVGD